MKLIPAVQVLAFVGVCISAVGMLASASSLSLRWTSALLLFLVTGTGMVAFRAVKTRHPLTAIIAGLALLLAAAAFLLIVTKNS